MSELGVLEKYIDMSEHNIHCYSSNCDPSHPKQGFEKEWQQARQEYDALINIAKIVDRYEKAPVGSAREQMIKMADSILSGSANISLKVDEDTVQILVIDGIERKQVATLDFVKFIDHLILKNYQFFGLSDVTGQKDE